LKKLRLKTFYKNDFKKRVFMALVKTMVFIHLSRETKFYVL